MIRLDCGRTVKVDAFYYNRTYSGLITGRPNRIINGKVVSKALTRMQLIWGERPIHMIPPNIDDKTSKHPKLPPIEVTVWLTCNDPIDSSFMGSELVLIWYCDEWKDESIANIFHENIKSIDWEKHAEDFDW